MSGQIKYGRIVYNHLIITPLKKLHSHIFGIFELFYFPTVTDSYFLRCFSTSRAITFNLFNSIHSIDDFAEHNMGSIKPLCFFSTYKKLRSIGIWSRVCHRKNARTSMFQIKVFVLKLVTVY